MLDIEAIVASGKLPDQKKFIDEFLLESTGEFIAREGDQWDFKEQWPHSYSDGYFGGLAKLVCAFSNTKGGLIIFGVNDETRKTKVGRIRPNVDAFETALRQSTGQHIEIDHKCYELDDNKFVDIVLIRERQKRKPPVVLVKTIANYPTDVVWVRKGSSSLPAQSEDVETVFLPTLPVHSITRDLSLAGGLPSSPSTLKTFVGRFNAIARIFRWIYDEDEPRAFLWGKGGSGKSTIAYEVCQHIKYNGKLVEFSNGKVADFIIYISAKKLY